MNSIELVIKQCPHDCTSLSKEEVAKAYNDSIVQLNSRICRTLFLQKKDKNISEEQSLFNLNIEKLIKEKQSKIEINKIEKKWHKELSNGLIDNAKKQRLERKLIVTAKEWLSDSKFLKPTKSNINSIIRWSSSRYAEMRKKDVVQKIHSIITNNEHQSIINEYSSGSVCVSGGLNGKGYTLISVRGITLLRSDECIYRFSESTNQILEELEKFTYDEKLGNTLSCYEKELESIGDKMPF